jgi:flagellar FliJ protein
MKESDLTMPFRYRLQKVLDFRIRKKEEQLLVVQKVQQRLREAEENIRRNNEEIEQTKNNMRQADPMMYETYDNYLIHLWEKAEKLEEIRKEIEIELEIEKKKLTELEQAVKVLEKHKEHQKEIYIEEEKKAELKTYSELGVTRFFRQSKDREEEELLEIQQLKDKKEIGG